MRGYVFNIEDKKIFTFGGASSHDIDDGVLDPVKDKEKIEEWQYDFSKLFRVLNTSWWPQELPTSEEMNRGLTNLAKVNYDVDFITTHTPSTSSLMLLGMGFYKPDILSDYLETIKQKTKYRKWFSGHLHLNQNINANDAVIYKQLVRIN